MKIRFLGHSFFQITFKSANVIIDPFIDNKGEDENLKRLIPCPIKKEELKNIDLILITHSHFDHFEKQLVDYLAKNNEAIVVGHDSVLSQLSLPNHLRRPIVAGKSLSVKGVNIYALPAHHPADFYPLSYLVECNNERVYHAGDTTLHDLFSEIKADVALLPIGGTFTMDIIDAVRATKTMKPKYVIPMHYNTFQEIQADVNDFKERIEKSILKTKALILQPGETAEL